jgi:hypothetical protein
MLYESVSKLSEEYDNIGQFLVLSKDIMSKEARLVMDLAGIGKVNILTFKTWFEAAEALQEIKENGLTLFSIVDTSEIPVSVSLLLGHKEGIAEILRFVKYQESIPIMATSGVNTQAFNELMREIFLKKAPEIIYNILEEEGIPINNIKYIAAHVPNQKLLVKLIKKVGLPMEALEPTRELDNLGSFGLAHAPLAVIRALENSQDGEKILMLTYDGAGEIVAALIQSLK